MKSNYLPLILLLPLSSWAMTLEDYRAQVYQKDPVAASQAQALEAAELKTRQGEQLTALRLLSGADFSDDTRHSSSPTFQGNRTTFFNSYIGVKQQSSLGLQWSLTQNLSRTKVYGVSPLFLPQNTYYDFYPRAEANINLWRNFAGAETRAQRDAADHGSRLQKLATLVEARKKDIEIESIFYKYGIQKNIYDLSEKNLDRTMRLYRWIQDRKSKNLVDESDLLQVQATKSLRELEFDRAKSSMKIALNDFNSLLGESPSDNATTAQEVSWSSLDPRELEKLSSGKKHSILEEIKLEESQAKLSQAKVDKSAALPSLDLHGGATYQGRDTSGVKSFEEMKDNKKNVWNIGLSFQMPLDFTLTRDLHKAASLESEVYSSKVARNGIDQNLAWDAYKEEIKKCAQSLKLLNDLENSQKLRFQSEESKYKKGRSTLFLVLVAEQDFINAQSQRLGNELQCRVLKAQSAFYVNEGTSL